MHHVDLTLAHVDNDMQFNSNTMTDSTDLKLVTKEDAISNENTYQGLMCDAIYI